MDRLSTIVLFQVQLFGATQEVAEIVKTDTEQ